MMRLLPRTPPQSKRLPAVTPKDRHPWGREVAVALISSGLVAIATVMGQMHIDDRRSQRELDAAQLMADESDRRENLRFVRQLSSSEDTYKPIGSVNLVDMDLRYLQLSNSRFDGAVLDEADLRSIDLTKSRLSDTSLVRTNFNGAILVETDFTVANAVGALFDHADLTGAEIQSSNFTRASFVRRIRRSLLEPPCTTVRLEMRTSR